MWAREEKFAPLLCVALALITVAPFLSIWRVGPIPSFFLETGSLLFVLFFVLLSIAAGCLRVRIPASSWYFVALAIFWSVQARWLNLTYVGMSDMPAYAFLILALACWACRGWVLQLGAERAVAILASVIVMGCALQSVVGWLQYTGLAAKFSGYLMYRAGIVEGQLAQRNHLGHYLMWGVLCASWLWAKRRLPLVWAIALVTLFASTMSLTGSRTVLAYILMLALWLPIYRLIGGRDSTRTVLALAVGSLIVLFCQYMIEPIVQWFSGTSNLQTATERLGGSQIQGSGRGYEWKKAWQIFLSAPLLGHGWGSYSLYGFLENVYPNGFRPYENNVLFTHSHNSFLNLLAEMGLLGTLLVIGGLFYAIKGSLQRINQNTGGLLIALIGVSLVHSVLEYPLWYLYFMSAFTLFIGFTSPANSIEQQPYRISSLQLILPIFATIAALAFSFGLVRLASSYQQLRTFATKPSDNVVERSKQIMGLLTIARNEPMLRYYAEFQLTAYIDPNTSSQPDWAEEVARRSLQYRPYANAHKYAFVAYQAGNIQAARDWLNLMYRYYPSKMPVYAAPIMNTPHYPQLRADYTIACNAYRQVVPSAPVCAEALPMLPSDFEAYRNRASRASP